MSKKLLYTKNGETMYIYIPSPHTDKFTRYAFVHHKNPYIKYDCWRILHIYFCDSDLTPLYSNLPGECECEGALRERLADGSVASDFIGGYHGDESLIDITVLVDGEELDLSCDYPLTECECVKATVRSYLFRVDSDEKVFERTKTDTFTNKGVEIKNRYETLAKISIERAATSLLGICLSDNGFDGLIREHWDNISQNWIEICDFETHQNKCNAEGFVEAKMRGLLDVYFNTYDCKINGEPTVPYGHFSYQAYKPKRVKIYVDPFRNRTLEVGDVYESTSFQAMFPTK